MTATVPICSTLDLSIYIGKVISDSDKVKLLKERWCPPSLFKFPPTGGRRYSILWEKQYSWLRYSVSKDAAFCVYCVLFGPTTPTLNASEVFQSHGFRDWKNAMGEQRGAIPCHQQSEAHNVTSMKAEAFIDVVEGSQKDIGSCLSTSYEKQVKRNRSILLSLIDILVLLGKRNFPFRGRSWDKDSHRQDGNFDHLVHWKSSFDPILRDHLLHCKKNASYLSPSIQNELIRLAGEEVRSQILAPVQSARWFSVMADECSDVSTIEQMALCI